MPRRISVQDEIRDRARRLAAAAPPLTEEQRQQIRMILRGAVPPALAETRDTGGSDAAA
jgi:hypothetical protein